MIFYFSATGNSKHVAERIAELTGDRAESIELYSREENALCALTEGESVGIVSPTYAWGLPIIVDEFLRKLHIQDCAENTYIWFLATYGTTPGQTGRFARDLLAAKGYRIRAFFSVKMPDAWTPVFDLTDKEKIRALNEAAETEIEGAADKIKERAAGDFMEHKVPFLAARAFYEIYYDKIRETKHLRVTDACIGCGLCARRCPAQAIALRDKRPVWVKERCAMCLGCLHRCPKFAIQYDNKTEKHGQYTYPVR